MIGLLAVLALGAAIGWAAGRRPAARASQRQRDGVGPHLLPDPALGWLRRSHAALGVWVAELDPEEEGPKAERLVDAERLSVAQIVAVDRRLERARDQEQSGVERMDGGTLVFRGAGGIAVGLLLAEGHATDALQAAEDDLGRLLDGVRRRPQIVALAQAQTQAASLETLGSVGLRLAYQLERAVEAEVVVAAVERAGTRVVGVSGRADRRLLDTLLPVDSELSRAARGETGQTVVEGDPLGGAVEDRRRRAAAVLLVPVEVQGQAVAAVAIWLRGGAQLPGPLLAEVLEAVRNAAPRLARAVELQGLREEARVDPLTGLANRRALEGAMARHGARQGALISCDFDRFKVLNDTLGHPAGDAALVHFARIIREQIRSADTGARVGGEEFAIWLPDANLALGVKIAERVRVKLGTTPWDWKGRPWPLSASFGVSACPDTSMRVENLSAQADAALYVAKRSGRNRVEAAGVGAAK
jgi:diguanylate cyclase (GGDEF)-like protein